MKFAGGFKVALSLAVLSCAAISGYMAGVRQTHASAEAPPKTYVLNLGPVHLILTVGAMGVLVILLLTILLAAAIVLAMVASYRRRRAEQANRQLTHEIELRRRAEGEIKELNADLERRVMERTGQLDAANRELEAFSYSVAHDLRAPLRHIDGFSQILLADYSPALDATAQKYLNRVREGARNMGQLLDDLLKMGQIGRQELVCKPTGLNSVVESALRDLQPECEGRQIEWRIGQLPRLDCDPGLMQQVFANLLSNAVKYTRRRAKAVIEVGQATLDGVPVIFIRDNGAGFNQQYAHKLFGAFQRLHRVEEFEGTGIGLATVQRIVQKHGGKIWAKAEVEKGATFYFTLGREPGTDRASPAEVTHGTRASANSDR